jgi:hypothetical protein
LPEPETTETAEYRQPTAAAAMSPRRRGRADSPGAASVAWPAAAGGAGAEAAGSADGEGAGSQREPLCRWSFSLTTLLRLSDEHHPHFRA